MGLFFLASEHLVEIFLARSYREASAASGSEPSYCLPMCLPFNCFDVRVLYSGIARLHNRGRLTYSGTCYFIAVGTRRHLRHLVRGLGDGGLCTDVDGLCTDFRTISPSNISKIFLVGSNCYTGLLQDLRTCYPQRGDGCSKTLLSSQHCWFPGFPHEYFYNYYYYYYCCCNRIHCKAEDHCK